MGPVSALSPHTHSQANTQKARVIMERNSPVISLFPLDSEQSASAASVREIVGHSSGERLNLHPLLLDVGSTLSLEEKIKVKKKIHPLRQTKLFNFLLTLASIYWCGQFAPKQLLLKKQVQKVISR